MTSAEMTEDELTAWGARIGEGAGAPLVLALRGDLGAGKTTLARAIIRGAGVEGAIPSPTYNLLLRYTTPRADIVHADLYRLDSEEDVWPLGWADLPADGEILLIEWPERAEGLLPGDRWEIQLEEVDDPRRRGVSVRRIGSPGPLPEAL